MHINTFRYTPEDVNCKLCTEYRGKRKRCPSCPWIAERMGPPQNQGFCGERRRSGMSELSPVSRKGGSERYGACGDVVGYEEAVRESFPHDNRKSHTADRLNAVIACFPGSLFLDADHRRRMEDMKARTGFRRRRDTPAWYAAMYLLTSSRTLRDRSINCFCKHGIEFQYATVQGISTHDYTLLSAAKDIYTDASGVSLNALTDRDVVDALAFTLIVNALLIARYGCAVLEISERRRT